MVKSLVSKLAWLFAGLLIFVPNLAGCEATPGVSTPLLPSDFTNTPVPDVNLDGYIYLNQGNPITILPDFLAPNIHQISVESAQLWLGSDANSIGGAVSFQNQADAQLISQLIKSYKAPVWSLTNSKVIYAVNNDSLQWTSSLKNALSQHQMASVTGKYPEVANDFAYFPAEPPSKPFVAGFINLDSNLAESIGTSFGLSLHEYTTALKSAKISRVNFIVYSAQPITISSKTLNEAYINSLQLGILAVGHSAYPSIALSAFFDKAMSDAGFTKQTVSNIDLYEYPLAGVKVLVAHKGNVIYAAASRTKELTEKLLLSCF